MPKLADHQSAQTTKMLLIGDSGAGKSGSLASLAAAGYNLRVMDLDNGLDVLVNLLRSSKQYEGGLARVHYETLTDKMKNMGGKLVPGKATVWNRAVGLLMNWPDLGPVVDWTPQDVLVIDSLTLLCDAAMNFVLAMNARLGQRPHQSDWYEAQQLVLSLIQSLYDDNVKCNVVVMCHISYIGEDNGPQQGYPSSLGKALSPKIGRYFNTTLMAKTKGSGQNIKRLILTQSQPMVELKNTAPSKVKAEYPLEIGLADYFRDVRA